MRVCVCVPAGSGLFQRQAVLAPDELTLTPANHNNTFCVHVFRFYWVHCVSACVCSMKLIQQECITERHRYFILCANTEINTLRPDLS